jgi:hypothetical protein
MAGQKLPIILGGTITAGLLGVGAYFIVHGEPPSRVSATSARPPVRSSTIGEGGAQGPLRGPQVYNYRPDGRHKAGFPLRPMDVDIFEVLEKSEYKREDMLDLFPDRPYKVQMFGSFVDHWIRAIQIDLDRDGVIDERWDLKPDAVRRTEIKHGSPPIPAELRFGLWLPY